MSGAQNLAGFTRHFPGMPSARGDSIPRFHIEPVQDEAATAAAGRPIFRDEERVEIIMPGNPLNRPVRVVTDEHRQRWPQQYAAFKAGTTMAADGTPIEQWSVLTPAMVRTLKYLEIHTVEQCAGLNDLAIQRVGIGGRQIRDAAVAYLDDAASQKMLTEKIRAVEIKDAQIEALTAQVQQMGEIVRRLQHEALTRGPAHSEADTFLPGVPGFTPSQPPVDETSALDGFVAPRRRGRPPNASRQPDAASLADSAV